jgi:sulfite exporter TauE/SafE
MLMFLKLSFIVVGIILICLGLYILPPITSKMLWGITFILLGSQLINAVREDS